MLQLTSIFQGGILFPVTEQFTLVVTSEALEVAKLRGPLLYRVTSVVSLLGMKWASKASVTTSRRDGALLSLT